jgi:hypothetical protein
MVGCNCFTCQTACRSSYNGNYASGGDGWLKERRGGLRVDQKQRESGRVFYLQKSIRAEPPLPCSLTEKKSIDFKVNSLFVSGWSSDGALAKIGIASAHLIAALVPIVEAVEDSHFGQRSRGPGLKIDRSSWDARVS